MSDHEGSDVETEPQYEISYLDTANTVINTKPHNHIDPAYTGKATVKFTNGDTFNGAYTKGQRHGAGIYTYVNGAKYDGEYSKGLKQGTGTFTYPDRSVYTGAYTTDQRTGHGTYTYSNGDVYAGGWLGNKKHGNGVYTYSAKAAHSTQPLVCTGKWVSNKLIYAQFKYADGNVYTGQFNQYSVDGNGVYQYSKTGNVVHGHVTADSQLFHAPTVSHVKPETYVPHSVITPADAVKQAERQIIRGCLVADQWDGVKTVEPVVEVAPMFRASGAEERAIYLTSQPTKAGLSAIIDYLADNGRSANIQFVDVRSDAYVYINGQSYNVRDDHTLTQRTSVFDALTLEELTAIEKVFVTRVKQHAARHGQLLTYYKQTSNEIPSDVQSTEQTVEVETTINEDAETEAEKVVQSICTAADVVEELAEGGADITYLRVPLYEDKVCTAQQIDALLKVFNDNGTDDVTYIFSSVSGKHDVTLAAVVRELLFSALNPEPEPEPEEAEGDAEGDGADVEDAEVEAEEEKDAAEQNDVIDEAEEEEEQNSDAEGEDGEAEPEDGAEGETADAAADDKPEEKEAEPTPATEAPAVEPVVEAVPVPELEPVIPTFTTTYTYIDQLLQLIDTDVGKQEKLWKQISQSVQAHGALVHLINYIEQCKTHVIDLPNNAEFDPTVQRNNNTHAQYWLAQAKLQLQAVAQLIVVYIYLQSNAATEFEVPFSAWFTHARQRKFNEFLRKQEVELNWQQ